MITETTQSLKIRKAAQDVLSTTRKLRGVKVTVSTPDDVPMDFKQLGKDLVATFYRATKSDRDANGHYTDFVDYAGRTFKVFTRVVRPGTNFALSAKAAGGEIACINYADRKDRPDYIVLVVHNPYSKSVDIFSFHPQDTENHLFPPSLCVTFSRKTQSYTSKEEFKVGSFPV